MKIFIISITSILLFAGYANGGKKAETAQIKEQPALMKKQTKSQETSVAEKKAATEKSGQESEGTASPIVTNNQIKNGDIDMEKYRELVSFLKARYPDIIRPAFGSIPYPYLIPGGFYNQQWDWDAYFMAIHLCNRKDAQPIYLKYWVDNFLSIFDPNEDTPACVRADEKVVRHPSLILKPFFARGAVRAMKDNHDEAWGKAVFPKVESTIERWERVRRDKPTGLFFWHDAMMSGADNNPAIGNAPEDNDQVLSCDVNAYIYAEYLALSEMASILGYKDKAKTYEKKAEALKAAIIKYLYHEDEHMFWNRRRDGQIIRRNAFSNYIPLTFNILPKDQGSKVITEHLLKPDMFSPYGFRSLSRSDFEYNNACIIAPYSNWQGPIWVNANYYLCIALNNYGFHEEAKEATRRVAQTLLSDLHNCGSLHENYCGDCGGGLAPSADMNNGKEGGFVSWNLLIVDMLEENFPETFKE